VLNILPRSLNKIQSINIRQAFMSAILICALLFSFAVHAQHADLTFDHTVQDCQLCQQYIDTIDNNIEINHPLTSYYCAYSSRIYELTHHSNNSVHPPLRASPAIF